MTINTSFLIFKILKNKIKSVRHGQPGGKSTIAAALHLCGGQWEHRKQLREMPVLLRGMLRVLQDLDALLLLLRGLPVHGGGAGEGGAADEVREVLQGGAAGVVVQEPVHGLDRAGGHPDQRDRPAETADNDEGQRDDRHRRVGVLLH